MSKIAIITPTGNRPESFYRLADKYLLEQTVHPDYWFIADDGINKLYNKDATYPAFIYRRFPSLEDKATAFTTQVLRLINMMSSYRDIEYVIVMEDDDWYDRDYIKTRVDQLKNGAIIAGSKNALYYNIEARRWRHCGNTKRASFCETAFHANLIPTLLRITEDMRKRRSVFVDAELWKVCVEGKYGHVLDNKRICVGMKGLPGRTGIGIGHRPNRKECWKVDHDWSKLVSLVGEEDAKFYKGLVECDQS